MDVSLNYISMLTAPIETTIRKNKKPKGIKIKVVHNVKTKTYLDSMCVCRLMFQAILSRKRL